MEGASAMGEDERTHLVGLVQQVLAIQEGQGKDIGVMKTDIALLKQNETHRLELEKARKEEQAKARASEDAKQERRWKSERNRVLMIVAIISGVIGIASKIWG